MLTLFCFSYRNRVRQPAHFVLSALRRSKIGDFDSKPGYGSVLRSSRARHEVAEVREQLNRELWPGKGYQTCARRKFDYVQ